MASEIKAVPTPCGKPTSHRWALVLAGGDGTRMNGVMQEWFGEVRPKQFCAFTGRKSMLEHTWQRATQIAAPERVVTVAVNKHRRYFDQWKEAGVPGRILFQPLNRGTATAIFFGVAHILTQDPAAEVVILPSDHYIAPDDAFLHRVQDAFNVLERDPAAVVLLAAKPDSPNADYGWMEPLEMADDAPHVRRFLEKPDTATARQLFEAGALWSTMICVARTQLLWTLGQSLLPVGFARRLDHLRELCRFIHEGVSPSGVEVSLMLTFYQLPVVDFSDRILRRCAAECRVVVLENVEWDDWGRPERVLGTLQRHALPANFHWQG